MQCLIDSLIYLVAIMGIIVTTLSLFSMFYQEKKVESYRIYSRYNDKSKNCVKIIIKLNNLNEEDEKKLIEKLKDDQKIDLKEIASSIIIQKEV